MCGSTRNVARVARPFPSTIKLSITKQERGKGLAGQTNVAPYFTQFTGHELFSTSSCALAFSYRSQVELGRKVCITYTTSSHGLQLALVW